MDDISDANILKKLIDKGVIDDEIAFNILESLDSLYNFYKRFIASRYPHKVEAPHIKELSETLEDMYDDKLKRLCVAMPPRHSKSSLITLAYPIWLIFHNPNLKILIINAEASLSESFGIRLREIVKQYGALFNVYLSDTKYSSKHLMFMDKDGRLYDGSIRLTGASGSITGHDANYLILDDVYKGFEDITDTLLHKKIEWFKTMIIQRMEVDTKLIILHTRWSQLDLQGYLKKHHKEEYKFIEYSAIKDDGSPLWSERYDTQFFNEIMDTMGERLFMAIYQQKPLDDTGSFFDVSKIIFHDTPPLDIINSGHISRVRSWDFAYSDNSKGDLNDSTAGVLMYLNYEMDAYVITDINYGQYGDNLKNVLLNVAKLDTPNTPVLMEPGTKGGASKMLFNEYSSYLQGFRCIQSEPIGSKSDRAYPLKQAILDNKLHVCLTNPVIRDEFIKQFKGFPMDAKHDDIVDACAYAYNYLHKLPRESVVAVGGYRPRITLGGRIGGDNGSPISRYRQRYKRRVRL